MDFDSDEFDYLCELIDLQHKPIDGPRPHHIGENVFAFQWEQLMERGEHDDDPPNARLARILHPLTRNITQRHASVAASFITWLGTNCGNALIHRSLRLYFDAQIGREESFVAAFAIENMPKTGNPRIIDAILAPAQNYGRDLLSGAITLQRLPDVSIDDQTTIELVAAWCGTAEGCKFVRMCEEQIRQRERVTVEQSIRIIAGVPT